MSALLVLLAAVVTVAIVIVATFIGTLLAAIAVGGTK